MQTLRADDPALTQLLQAARNVELFKGFSENAVSQIFHHATLVQYEPDEIVIRENDPADSFLMILSGELGILDPNQLGQEGAKIIRIKPFATMGDVSLLLKENRTATIKAMEPTVIMQIGQALFMSMFKNPSFGQMISRGLAHILRRNEYQVKLNKIYKLILESDSLDEVLPLIERQMRGLMNAEVMIVYQRGKKDGEIVSRFNSRNDVKEIHIPLSMNSVEGYVALTHKPTIVDDMHDEEALARVHPEIQFDKSYDQKIGFHTKSMIVVPVKLKETFIGLLQFINYTAPGAFSEIDLKHATDLADLIVQKFKYDNKITSGPFDYLVQRKLLTKEQLRELSDKAEREKQSLASYLITEMRIEIDEIGESLERYYQVPFVKYDPERKLPMELVKNINQSYLIKNRWVPLDGDKNKVIVLIDDPNDNERISEVRKIIGATAYDFRVGITEEILAFLKAGKQLSSGGSQGAQFGELLEKMQKETTPGDSSGPKDATSVVHEDESVVIQLVNQMILNACTTKASDIHIEPAKGDAPAIVRMRIDGACQEAFTVPAAYISAVVSRVKILASLDISERRKPQDGKISIRLNERDLELRVATLPTVNGEAVVLRLLAAGNALPFNKLNMSGRNAQEVLRLIERPHGIFLVVGPTGSGKTTTLHALLGHVNTPDRKIWTAEDPVEITQPRMQQVQVQPKIGFTFANALRSFLRADPDIILIGEMRDKETSHIGVEASLTGHLVFSTLHANSAPETVTRLLGLELDPVDFSDALLGVLAQRLVRTLCPDCKETYSPAQEELDQLAEAYGNQAAFEALLEASQPVQLCRPGKCSKCNNTGYRGRTGIHELLINTHHMKKIIAESGSILDIRQQAIKEGMTTLLQDGIGKILQGQTDLATLLRVAASE